MAQREMNFNDLTKSIENVKQLAEAQRGHVFKYEIWYKNPYVSNELMQAGSGASNTTPNVVDQFNRDFDAVLKMDNVVYIKVIMKSKGRVIAQPEIIFKPEYAQAAPTFPAQQAKSEPAKALGNIETTDDNKLTLVRQRMAFANMIAGEELTQGVVFDEADGGITGSLIVRDRIREMLRENKDIKKENAELKAENAEQKQQIEENAKKEEENATALNGFEDEMDSLKEELADTKAELEKARSIGGLAGNAFLSILPSISRKLQASNKIPMLSGVFEALGAEEEPQPQQVAAAANEPRADHYNEFLKYARSLDDNDFGKLWQVICKCAKDKTAIDAFLGTQPATAVNGDDDAEEVEPEDVE